MKRTHYLLPLIAILAPGLVLAVTAPSGLTLQATPTAATNGYSVQLNWQNNGSYSAINIQRQDPGRSIPSPIGNISGGATSYTDTNQNQQWLPANDGAYQYTVTASQSGQQASAQGSVSMPFVDSNIVTV